MNTVQEYAEASRLGVPVLVSMDSVHGLSYVTGATVTPHNLALAATRDEELVTKLAEIARDEHIAIGVRMTLSPESDIASEPRWGRVMETFGEDPDLVTAMVRAQIVAFQNGEDGINQDGIVACIKHFPGAGPQMDGKDTSPIVSDEETLEIHLMPYYAAIEVNVGSVMPYYSVPLALDMENSAIGSKAALQDLLREQMGFEGIIQTDWGMIWAIQEGLGTMTATYTAFSGSTYYTISGWGVPLSYVLRAAGVNVAGIKTIAFGTYDNIDRPVSYNYIFGYRTLNSTPSGKVTLGFFRPTGSNMPANSAYLYSRFNVTSDAPGFPIFFDDAPITTAIDAVESTAADNAPYYNLQGMRIANPSKGLFIQNGKKVILK